MRCLPTRKSRNRNVARHLTAVLGLPEKVSASEAYLVRQVIRETQVKFILIVMIWRSMDGGVHSQQVGGFQSSAACEVAATNIKDTTKTGMIGVTTACVEVK